MFQDLPPVKFRQARWRRRSPRLPVTHENGSNRRESPCQTAASYRRRERPCGDIFRPARLTVLVCVLLPPPPCSRRTGRRRGRRSRRFVEQAERRARKHGPDRPCAWRCPTGFHVQSNASLATQHPEGSPYLTIDAPARRRVEGRPTRPPRTIEQVGQEAAARRVRAGVRNRSGVVRVDSKAAPGGIAPASFTSVTRRATRNCALRRPTANTQWTLRVVPTARDDCGTERRRLFSSRASPSATERSLRRPHPFFASVTDDGPRRWR